MEKSSTKSTASSAEGDSKQRQKSSRKEKVKDRSLSKKSKDRPQTPPATQAEVPSVPSGQQAQKNSLPPSEDNLKQSQPFIQSNPLYTWSTTTVPQVNLKLEMPQKPPCLLSKRDTLTAWNPPLGCAMPEEPRLSNCNISLPEQNAPIPKDSLHHESPWSPRGENHDNSRTDFSRTPLTDLNQNDQPVVSTSQCISLMQSNIKTLNDNQQSFYTYSVAHSKILNFILDLFYRCSIHLVYLWKFDKRMSDLIKKHSLSLAYNEEAFKRSAVMLVVDLGKCSTPRNTSANTQDDPSSQYDNSIDLIKWGDFSLIRDEFGRRQDVDFSEFNSSYGSNEKLFWTKYFQKSVLQLCQEMVDVISSSTCAFDAYQKALSMNNLRAQMYGPEQRAIYGSETPNESRSSQRCAGQSEASMQRAFPLADGFPVQSRLAAQRAVPPADGFPVQSCLAAQRAVPPADGFPVQSRLAAQRAVPPADGFPVQSRLAAQRAALFEVSFPMESHALVQQGVFTASDIRLKSLSSVQQNVPSAASSSQQQNVSSATSSSVQQNVPSITSSSVQQNAPSITSSSVQQNVPSTTSSSVQQSIPPGTSTSGQQNVLSTTSYSVQQNVPSTTSSSVQQSVPSGTSSSVQQNVPSTNSSFVQQNIPSATSSSVQQSVPSGTTSPMRTHSAVTSCKENVGTLNINCIEENSGSKWTCQCKCYDPTHAIHVQDSGDIIDTRRMREGRHKVLLKHNTGYKIYYGRNRKGYTNVFIRRPSGYVDVVCTDPCGQLHVFFKPPMEDFRDLCPRHASMLDSTHKKYLQKYTEKIAGFIHASYDDVTKPPEFFILSD